MAVPSPRRIDAGDVLAALGALLVLVSLFLAWFGDVDGWQVFEALDLVLAGLALAALAAAATGAGLLREPSPRLLLPIGLALLAIVALQLIQPPPVVADADPDRGAGAWLALAGALLVVIGGLLRVARLSVSVTVAERDARPRVPAVDRREDAIRVSPAPPAPAPAESGATQSFRPVDEP